MFEGKVPIKAKKAGMGASEMRLTKARAQNLFDSLTAFILLIGAI